MTEPVVVGPTPSAALKKFAAMIEKLQAFASHHKLIEGYYEGTKNIPMTQGSIPPTMQHIRTVVGWPATAVDVLEERIDFRGWDADKKLGLQEAYENNALESESGMNHLDTLLHGCGFVTIGKGDDDEPKALITVESPQNLTGVWDARKRRLSVAGLRRYDADGKFTMGTLYEADRTVYYRRLTEHDRWAIESIDDHRLGRVPVVRFSNRGRAGRREGRSEITRAVRSYTDMGVRTLLGMEVNREFFQAPQRYVLGAKENAFVDEAGNPIPQWKAIMGRIWGLERDEEWVDEHGGEGMPQVGQFDAVTPGPYLDQIRGLAQLFSAEVAIPPTYLGFATDQAASADAIRALESRLVKRGERRQTSWTAPWVEVGQLTAQFMTASGSRPGTLPPRSDVQALWGDPATPTRSADADRAVKLVGANIIPADSSVTRDMVGLTPGQQKRLERDMNKKAFLDVLRGGGVIGAPGTADGAGQAVGGNAPAAVANSNGNQPQQQ